MWIHRFLRGRVWGSGLYLEKDPIHLLPGIQDSREQLGRDVAVFLVSCFSGLWWEGLCWSDVTSCEQQIREKTWDNLIEELGERTAEEQRAGTWRKRASEEGINYERAFWARYEKSASSFLWQFPTLTYFAKKEIIYFYYCPILIMAIFNITYSKPPISANFLFFLGLVFTISAIFYHFGKKSFFVIFFSFF